MYPAQWRTLPNPPALSTARPGTALVMSCQPKHNQGTLCLLTVNPHHKTHKKCLLPLGPTALQAHKEAIIALNGALPLLWSSLHTALHQTPQYALRLNTVRLGDKGVIVRPQKLEGRSLGLAMGLAMASQVLKKPVPPHFVAASTLNSMGQTGPVDGLPLKINALLHGCPGLDALEHPPVVLVHPQQDTSTLDPQGRIQFDKVTSLSEAIARVWGNDLAQTLLQDIQSTEQRQEFIHSIFAMTIGDRSVSRIWAPIANAARMASNNWQHHNITPTQRWQLKLVESIATRHDGQNPPHDPWPEDETLGELPQPMRLQAVAHLIQQTTTDINLDADRALALGRKHLLHGMDAFEGHLRVLGAMGRLMAVSGQPIEALKLQLEAAKQWQIRRAFYEMSYPMCQLYHLAGAIDDDTWTRTPDFCRMELLKGLESSFLRIQTLAPDKMSSYLTKARAQTRLLLEQWPGDYSQEAARKDIENLWHSRSERLYLNWSAGRQLARWHRQQGNTAALKDIEMVFERQGALPKDQAHNRETYRALMALDAALDTPGASTQPPTQALDAFQRCRPALTSRLMDSSSHMPPRQQADHVRRFYPY